MTHLALRLISSLVIPASTWFFWKRETRKEREKRAIQDRLDSAIRGY